MHILIPVLIFVFCIALIYGLEKENLLSSNNFKVNETPYAHLITKEMTKDSQNKIKTPDIQANKTQVINKNQSSGTSNLTNNSSGSLSFSP